MRSSCALYSGPLTSRSVTAYAAANATSKPWVLPIPATCVLDSTGLVVLSYLDPDHTMRLEPADVIVALSHCTASIPRRNER